MKKLLIFLPVMLIVTIVFSSNLSFFDSTQQVNKEINLSIFSENNYSSEAYSNAKAAVEITVSKVNENKTIVIGKKAYSSLSLQQFPSAINAFNKKLYVAGTFTGNEVLMITYTVTYNSNGSLITFQNSQMVNKKTAKDNINISI